MPAPTTENAARLASLTPSQEERDTSARQNMRSAETQVEVVRVLNPHTPVVAPEENPVRSRANMLAAWLREGGERADLPPLPSSSSTAQAPAQSPSKEAPQQVSRAKILGLSARQLALRLQLLSGEIAEQNYGATRRWAILDNDGEVLEAPARPDVEELIEAGLLALSHFEKGAAVWRLQKVAEKSQASRREARPARKLAC